VARCYGRTTTATRGSDAATPIVIDDDVGVQLASWIATQLPDADDVQVGGLESVAFGHSAETLLLTVTWRSGRADRREDVVVRIRPPEPGLLPPYDLHRQFEILRRLEATTVRAPRALWYEGTGAVLGRELYVMERLPGTVYERSVPDELAADPDRVRHMCEEMVDQLAAIHTVDLRATGLDALGDGHGYVDRELVHWAAEIDRVRRGRLPALERLHGALLEQQPAPNPVVTLVHGDPKPGNFAFVDGDVTGVFDWEMATVGDPLADVAWTELLWGLPGTITGEPSSPSADELVARWERATGIRSEHREWYRALQLFKTAAILLVGGQLFDDGHTDDLRFASMARMIPGYTRQALGELGIEEQFEPGPLLPRPERVAAARANAQTHPPS